MSLVTLEGIKTAVPTLLSTIGSFLGRAVTVITANPTTVAAVIIGVVYAIYCINNIIKIINNDNKINKLDEELQKSKDILTEMEVKNIEKEELFEEQRVYSECLDAEVEATRRMLERQNQKMLQKLIENLQNFQFNLNR